VDRLQVVVVSYNNERTIADCLAAAETACKGFRAKITLVDNASTDGTADVAEDRYLEAKVIRLRENIGFAAGNNLVLGECRAPLVLLLNPDTSISPDAITILAEALERHRDAALAGPRLVYADGSAQVSFGPFPGPLRDLRQRKLVLGCRRGDSEAVGKVERMMSSLFFPDWVSGACFLARTAALRGVGFFDADFFLYLEDVDLCRRLRAAGWRVLVEPRARCLHLEGHSHPDPATMRDRFRRSRLLYENKHGSRLGFLIYKLLRARDVPMRYDPRRRFAPARAGERGPR